MAPFLPHAVDSVLAQSHPHLEVIVVDDGSTDGTRESMARYGGEPRVRYHYQTNGGVSAARNSGLRLARGAIIGLCDADDMWAPAKLERQLPHFTRPEIGVVYTDAQWVDAAGSPLPTRAWGGEHRVSGRITAELFVRNMVTGSTSLIRRECFDKVGYYDESLTAAEDYDLWLRISTEYEFAYLDEVTYLYRRWDGQTSRNSVKVVDSNVRVLQRFQGQYAHALPRRAVREAWSRLMTDRAIALTEAGRRKEGFASVGAALRTDPSYAPAWKTALKIAINRV